MGQSYKLEHWFVTGQIDWTRGWTTGQKNSLWQSVHKGIGQIRLVCMLYATEQCARTVRSANDADHSIALNT